MVKSGEWSLSLASGGKAVSFPNASSCASIFSQDGRYNIVLLNRQIRVYFVSTRQCIKTIEVDCSEVVGAKIDIMNGNHLLLFSSLGRITTVNWREKVDEAIISREDIKTNVVGVVSVKEKVYYLVSGKMQKYSLRTLLKVNRSNLEVEQILNVDSVTHYTISNDCEKILFINTLHQAILYNLSILDDSEGLNLSSQVEATKEVISFNAKSQVTSLAVSNTSTIAIGFHLGAIQLLYGGLLNSKPHRVFKWHIDQVKSLEFTPDGNYLLSGGLEKVLVFWHLETDKNQFLPRLNGIIENITIDESKSDYYTLTLKSDNEFSNNDSNLEILIISAIDLVSRLSINTIKPKFNNPIHSSLAKTRSTFNKNPSNFDLSKLIYDYSSSFEIHPITNHLYFPYDSSIQSYDPIKNEQNFMQDVAPTLNTGKVRSETKLAEPVVSLLSFTQNGEWMCTFDSVATSEVDNLLSKDDTQYALKFWKFIEKSTAEDKQGHWELTTKILDPHGNSSPIVSIIPAPSSYHQGTAFLTADNKGGLRVWRPRIPKEIYKNSNSKQQQTAWTLRKSKPSGAMESDSVDCAWSDDGSIIILGHELSISLISSTTFETIPYEQFKIPSLTGSKIRSLKLIDNNLIILSKTRITSFNLLTGQKNSLVAQVNTTIGGKNLISIDRSNQLICLGVNYYSKDNSDLNIKSKIFIFKPDQLKPVSVLDHNKGISSIRYFNSSFIFVDLNSTIGYISSSKLKLDKLDESLLKIDEPIKPRTQPQSQSAPVKIDDSSQVVKAIDVNTFQPVFDNIEGIQIDALFDRIVKIVN